MVNDARIEILQLVVRTYTHDGVAKFLHVPSGKLHRWLVGTTAVPDTVLASLDQLLEPSATLH
jgi:hypothetical protein